MRDTNYSGAGRSRARGQSRARNARPSNNTSKGSSAARNHRSGRHPNHNDSGNNFMKIAVGGVVLIVAIALAAGFMKGAGNLKPKDTEPAVTESTTEKDAELLNRVSVNGIDITGLSRDEAMKKVLGEYRWGMKITYGEESCDVRNLLEARAELLFDEIYGSIPAEAYVLDAVGLEDAAAEAASAAASLWDRQAKNGGLSGYDNESGEFVFSEEEKGIQINQEELAQKILSAFTDGQYEASIEAPYQESEAEISGAAAREKYKTVASFTTETTANSKRNTNVRLAAQKLNGTILQPGEEFSFNDVVGERTEAAGYQTAAAYNNGEVVQEIGGGVCQVSSTLYNAVLRAGLKTTLRRSHTFEPSYVKPGTDATVSWGGPDYKFVNNSSSTIGIRASYADRKTTVSIYAIPILEEGVTYSLESQKIKDYTTGTPEEQASGYQSKWEVRLIVKRDGNIESRNIDHTTTYKRHTDENDAAAAEEILKAASLAAEEASRAAEEASRAAEEAQNIEEGPAGEIRPEAGSPGSGNSGSGSTSQPGSGSENSTQFSGPVSAPGAAEPQETTAAPKQTSDAPTAAESRVSSSADSNVPPAPTAPAEAGTNTNSGAPGSSAAPAGEENQMPTIETGPL